jgi:hypothetical protein
MSFSFEAEVRPAQEPVDAHQAADLVKKRFSAAGLDVSPSGGTLGKIGGRTKVGFVIYGVTEDQREQTLTCLGDIFDNVTIPG